MKKRLGWGIAAALGLWPAAALAHAADRGFVMLLPTGYYLAGGAAAVAMSAVVLAFLPAAPLLKIARWRLALWRPRIDGRAVTSWLSFLVLGGLVFAGFEGSRDPLSNPLPLIIWTVWWAGMTLLSGLLGNIWRWLDPWYGPAWLVTRIVGRDPDKGFLRLPAGIGQRPAIGLFFAFAWFELIDPAPTDPDRLAFAVAAYWVFTFAGILLAGHAAWTRHVEPFSIFFGMIGRLSPFSRKAEAPFSLLPPGGKLVDAPPLTPSGTLFLLLALSTVSFDGLMHTFRWLALIGVNPLEFEGRSSVIAANTLGMAGMFAVVACAFLGAIATGGRLAGAKIPFWQQAGLLVWSIVPIALAYHFAHYLIVLAINGQYAFAAISDPLSNGANLFGTARYHVVAGVTMGLESAWIIWNLQAGAIIGGHVLAVLIAHVIAYRIHGDEKRAVLSQLPLAVLMVAYTAFGLWLLSTPTA